MRAILIFVLVGWSGFFVMSLELLGGRILAPDFGSSIFVWGAVIAVFMSALALGYLVGGFWSTRRAALRDLGGMLLLQAGTTLVSVLIADRALTWIFWHTQDARYGSLAAALVLFFVPTAISGMVSPYAVRLLVRDVRLSGQSAGLLYFVSTFGSAAGTITTSFYLVLLLEIDQILYWLVGLSVVIGSLPFCVRERSGQ